MLSKAAWSVAAAGAGICFIGYCIYFDHKRRNDPMFRSKLRESEYRSCRVCSDRHIYDPNCKRNIRTSIELVRWTTACSQAPRQLKLLVRNVNLRSESGFQGV